MTLLWCIHLMYMKVKIGRKINKEWSIWIKMQPFKLSQHETEDCVSGFNSQSDKLFSCLHVQFT